MTPKKPAALALAAKGFAVFPLKEGAKFPPLVKNWPARASTSSKDVSGWWTRWPSANVGIHCAGLVVLDVDVRNGGDGTLKKIHFSLPTTLTTRTPTGGCHLFFRLPEGHPGVTNNTPWQGIDIKSTGGYVVAPGSEVGAGRYRFEADVPIADAPEWLLRELGTAEPKTGMKATPVSEPATPDLLERAKSWLQSQPRGDQAFKTACGLRDLGLDVYQALDALLDHDGRPASVLQPKVDHAYTYAKNEPGVRAVSAADFPVAETPPEPAKKERVRPRRLSEVAKLSTGRTGYLIKGLLQRGSHVVLYGAPGEGKTFVGLDLAYHVAAGREWHGRRVHQGLVLYLAYEGVGGMAKRAAALMQKYGDDDVPLYVQGADYNLRELTGRQLLAADLACLPEKPVFVVIDTLARAMKGGDENSAQDMGALNDAVGALIDATGACVVLIHHSGKNKAGGARGSSALLGAIDTELEVDSKQVLSRKQRDVELADAHGFKLVPVVVGVDEDGEDVSSCVVEPAKVANLDGAAAGLKGNSKRAFEVLCAMSPNNEPVSRADWAAACKEFLPATRGNGKAMYDLTAALKKSKLIEVEGAFVTRVLV